MAQRKINEREDPRVLRTRQLLLQAFTDLFLEKGFHAITVQDITERASVNRGTFYTHFADKSAILEYWLREQFQQRIASPTRISDTWNQSTFCSLILTTVEWFTQLHQLLRSSDRSLIPLVVITLQEALFELLLQGFKAIATPGPEQQADLETAAMVTSWAIFGTGFRCFNQWGEQPMAVPPKELASQVTGVLMHGLTQILPAFPLD